MLQRKCVVFFIAQTFVHFEAAAVLEKKHSESQSHWRIPVLSQDKVGKVRAASLWACTVFKLERRRRRDEKRRMFGRDTGVTVRSLA